MTYEILEGGKAIKCRVCGVISWHPKDVQHKFCGKCHIFHADLNRASLPPQRTR